MTKDELYPVILRVIKKRKTKKIALGFYCRKEQWDETNFQFKKTYPNYIQRNRILLKLKSKAFKIIDDYRLEGVDFTLNQFEAKFRGKDSSKVTVIEFWQELIDDLIEAKRIGNASVHTNTLKSFYKFNSNKNLLFRDITSETLDKYETFLRSRGCQDGGIAVRMREIRALYNSAIKKGLIDVKYYPFKEYKISKLKGKGIKRALTREEFKKIESFNTDKYPHLLNAKNYFLFSYYTRGMNFYDMLKLEWDDIQGDRILYIRSKTKGRFSIKIMKPVKNILIFYKNQNRTTPFVFPLLIKEGLTAIQINNRKNKTLKAYNKQLKEIAEILGMSKKISSYTARHSFATHLKYAGISTDVIGESLGHRDIKVTRAYLKEFEDDVLDEAMKKLLEEPIPVFG